LNQIEKELNIYHEKRASAENLPRQSLMISEDSDETEQLKHFIKGFKSDVIMSPSSKIEEDPSMA